MPPTHGQRASVMRTPEWCTSYRSPTLFGGSLAVYGREEADPIVGGRRSWTPLVGSDLLFDVLLDD